MNATSNARPVDVEPEAEAEAPEAFQVLQELAHRKTGTLPEALLARHVLTVTAGADWPVQRAALDAVLRRLASVQREKLRIGQRPAQRHVLGAYVTVRGGRRGGERPYATVLLGVDPPEGRCDCPDFRKNSLGLCKHLLALLLLIYP